MIYLLPRCFILFTGRKITLYVGAAIVAAIVVAVIVVAVARHRGRNNGLSEPAVARFYKLPDAHQDNANPLKAELFQEPFKDIKGGDMKLDDLRGKPLVVLMFPSFRTMEGQESLYLLEQLHRKWPDQFQSAVIPYESADTVKPAIVKDPSNMWFLFRKGHTNPSLLDHYSPLFWDTDIIMSDFPQDPPERHRTSPFFWIVDGTGTIREKLVCYSPEKKITIGDLSAVMTALIGPPVVQNKDAAVSTSGNEESAK